jgi:hypothetical protein
MRALILVALAAGCLEEMTYYGEPDGGARDEERPSWATASSKMTPKADSPTETPDAAEIPDLLPPPPPDLRPADLAGLTNCYDKAYCDRATMFCLRYIEGSPGKPGAEKNAPSCYAPNEPCANGTLDCACIQADAVLGPSCATCFDNQDGTFTCYAQ